MTKRDLVKLAEEVTGTSNLEEALETSLQSYLEQKIRDYNGEIESLEKKYGMSFEKFKKNLGENLELSWEHERDFMQWEEAITNLKYFQEQLDRLENKEHVRS